MICSLYLQTPKVELSAVQLPFCTAPNNENCNIKLEEKLKLNTTLRRKESKRTNTSTKKCGRKSHAKEYVIRKSLGILVSVLDCLRKMCIDIYIDGQESTEIRGGGLGWVTEATNTKYVRRKEGRGNASINIPVCNQ